MLLWFPGVRVPALQATYDDDIREAYHESALGKIAEAGDQVA